MLAEKHNALAAIAHEIPYGHYCDAQIQFSEEHFADDVDLSEAFWDEVGQRPGIEETWSMTLQQALDLL